MPSRWLLLLALGWGVSVVACGPEKKYCIKDHAVCTSQVMYDGGVDELEPEQQDGPIILPSAN